MSERAKLILDPATWYRGMGDYESSLRRVADGRMCCLGFDCIRRGLRADDITDKAFPSEVGALGADERKELLRQVKSAAWSLEMDIAGINDDDEIPVTRDGDVERVRKLQRFFDELDVELVLADDPPGYDRAAAIEEQNNYRRRFADED